MSILQNLKKDWKGACVNKYINFWERPQVERRFDSSFWKVTWKWWSCLCVGNCWMIYLKTKGRNSKRVFHKDKAHQIFRKTNISYPLIRTEGSPLDLAFYFFTYELLGGYCGWLYERNLYPNLLWVQNSQIQDDIGKSHNEDQLWIK